MEGRGRDSLGGALHGDAGDDHHGGDFVEEEDTPSLRTAAEVVRKADPLENDFILGGENHV